MQPLFPFIMFSWAFQKKMGVRSHVIFPTACISTVLIFLPNSCHSSDLFSKHLAWGVFWTLLGLLTSNHWPSLYFSALAMSTLTAIATWSSVTAWQWISITKCHLPCSSKLPKLGRAVHMVFPICFSPLIHLQLMKLFTASFSTVCEVRVGCFSKLFEHPNVEVLVVLF